MLDKLAAGDDPDGGAALRAADIELRLGRPDQARQRAEKVLARDPRNARALRIKAQALFAARTSAQATTIARAAVAAEPVRATHGWCSPGPLPRPAIASGPSTNSRKPGGSARRMRR